VLPDGAVIAVTGALLLGRDPVRFDEWTTAILIKLDDPAKSVSKTHAVLELHAGGLRVTDLHSTNGVFLTAPDGIETALESGASASIISGSSLDLGRYTILVDQN
jgi:predicted component of type VI protein secretion system